MNRQTKCFSLSREEIFDGADSSGPEVIGYLATGSLEVAFRNIKRVFKLSNGLRLSEQMRDKAVFSVGSYVFTIRLLPGLPNKLLP